MDRKGGVPGGVVSEVRNQHSGKWYFISTCPERPDWCVTVVYPAITETKWFGLRYRRYADLASPLRTIVRYTLEESHIVHGWTKAVVEDEKEDEWYDYFPRHLPDEAED